MALIDCPACKKKISDKAEVCQHCEFAIGEASAEDILRKENLNRHKKLHGIQNQSMLAMLIFIASFGFMSWGGVSAGEMQHNLAILGAVVGFVWYVVNRVRILYIKRFSS